MGYRRSARCSQSTASFFRNEGKWKKTGVRARAREEKNCGRCGVEFPERRHFIPLLAAVFFSRGSFRFFHSVLSAESNSRIWIYYLLSSRVTFRLFYLRIDEKCSLSVTLLALPFLHKLCFYHLILYFTIIQWLNKEISR